MTTNLWVEQVTCSIAAGRKATQYPSYYFKKTKQVLVRLQTPVGAIGIRRGEHAARPVRSHLAAGYQPLQQVSLCVPLSVRLNFLATFLFFFSSAIAYASAAQTTSLAAAAVWITTPLLRSVCADITVGNISYAHTHCLCRERRAVVLSRVGRCYHTTWQFVCLSRLKWCVCARARELAWYWPTRKAWWIMNPTPAVSCCYTATAACFACRLNWAEKRASRPCVFYEGKRQTK